MVKDMKVILEGEVIFDEVNTRSWDRIKNVMDLSASQWNKLDQIWTKITSHVQGMERSHLHVLLFYSSISGPIEEVVPSRVDNLGSGSSKGEELLDLRRFDKDGESLVIGLGSDPDTYINHGLD
jgi:hypothetical protein